MLTLATSLLLVSQVSAGVLIDAAKLVRKDMSMEQNMRRYVDSIVEPVEKRQMATGPGMMNVTAWDAEATKACTSQLESLNGQASNPSGMAVCYNLPYLDNSTGVFEADLRLYMVAAPTGDFANVASTNVQVGLSYNGATVSPVNASSLKRDEEAVSLISWPRDIGKRVSVPTMVQSYAFVGQINANLLATPMGTAALQKVLVPAVTLTGKSTSGAVVNTTLSNSDATFVAGVFAAQVTPTKSQVIPPIQTLVVASDKPFVVPGLNILILPIGGIVTGIWTVLFIGTIAYGTVGRMQFREQYRRRKNIAEKGNLARI